jgi:hypothetical protein
MLQLYRATLDAFRAPPTKRQHTRPAEPVAPD